jgi:hypothetical protein
MKKFQWNTGRQYDAHGQRMVAVVDEIHNQLLFHDLSRGIPGAIPLGDYARGGRGFDKYDIERLVMCYEYYEPEAHLFKQGYDSGVADYCEWDT